MKSRKDIWHISRAIPTGEFMRDIRTEDSPVSLLDIQ